MRFSVGRPRVSAAFQAMRPSEAEPQGSAAEPRFAAGDIARSAELFHRAADVSRQDFRSPILEAQSLRMLGRMTEAEEATRVGVARAERLLALNPIDGRALSLGSAALFHDGQIVRAMEWSRRSLELHPDDMGTLLSAACLHFKRGAERRRARSSRTRLRAWLGQAGLGDARSGLRDRARPPPLQGTHRWAQVTLNDAYGVCPPSSLQIRLAFRWETSVTATPRNRFTASRTARIRSRAGSSRRSCCRT